MEPLDILRADPLDLLFEHRNKMYGAYPLRKYYPQRLIISMAIIFSGVVMLAFFYLRFRDQTVAGKKPDFTGDYIIQTIDPFLPPKPLPPPNLPHPPKPPAALEYVTPLIVRDEIPARTMAGIEDLGSHAIGLKTAAGESESEPTQSIGNGNEPAGTATDSAKITTEIFDHPEQMPEFPGGSEALKRFLQKNLRMPENNLESGTQVKVIARFVVGPDGRVRDVEILLAADEVFNREVRRVILKMPEWKPGMQHNRNVAVYFNLPVNFVAEE
jgi:protein TonB